MDHQPNEHEAPKEPGMGARGVARPMTLAQQAGDANDTSGDAHAHDGDQHTDRAQRLEMLRLHHRHTLWIPWTFIVLGIWLVLAPVTFGYGNAELWTVPSGGRGVWFSDETHSALRAALMSWSDVITGVIVLIFGWRTLKPNRPVSWWIICFAGIWLTFAPVLFWAPTAASYVNDSIVGMLLIALSILIPGMPNMIMYMQHGPPQPPGWSYNPSSWPQRWILIVTGLAGFVVSRALAAFQLGYIDHIWEPFFGDGTRKVLNSDMSHMWPISDAGLGAVSYTFEFLMGYMGSPARWRTMPWMVAFFGVLVIPLGLTHILLVISQPVVVGHWCTLCLLAAGIMLPMIPLEVEEVVAMGQHMVQAKRRGDRNGSLWTIFWKGGAAEGCTEDVRTPPLSDLPDHPWRVFRASIWGVSFPVTLIVSAVMGIALMCVPGVFDVSKPASAAHHLCGSLIVVVSVIAMGEVVRVGRWLNVPLGLGVAVAPWLLAGGEVTTAVIGTVLGLAVVALTPPRGVKREQYGLWDRFVV